MEHEYTSVRAPRATLSAASQIADKDAHLDNILGRVNATADALTYLVERLEGHADRVFGCRPEDAAADHPVPFRDGLLGKIEDALDRLGNLQQRLGETVDRNCTLA